MKPVGMTETIVQPTPPRAPLIESDVEEAAQQASEAND